jgi:anti-sigma factor RsiW
VSQQDQHPTIEQLSTWVDQQLTPEEQASCSTHLEDCEQCQYTLGNLQQTVNLLRSLPQLDVPRSFALPADFQITSDRDIQRQIEPAKVIPLRRLSTPLRQTLRVASALAAVIGLFFLLSSFITPLQPHPDTPSANSLSVPAPTNLPTISQAKAVPHATSGTTENDSANPSSNKVAKQAGTVTSPTAAGPTSPLDFNQLGIHLSIGIVLVVLGCMGFILLGQQKRSAYLARRN